jgi:hypothetical protein
MKHPGHTYGGFIPAISEWGMTTVEVLTVDNSTIVCFECHLIAGLGLPPSKFLVSILNFLGCELVHLNPNAITALSYLCYVNVGLGLFHTLAYSGTSIPPPGMITPCIPRSGYRCVAISGMVTLRRPSKVTGGVPPGDGFLLTCMFLLNVQTNICFRRLLTISGES